MSCYETLSILAQFSILAATGIYAWFAWGQWRAIRDTLDVARTQDRPWIMVTPDNPEGWPPDGIPSTSIGFTWSAENVGKSPAFLTHLWVAVVLAPYPVPDTRPDDQETGGFAAFIIPPGGKHTSRERRLLTESDIADITAGRKCLMFYGVIRYNDTFTRTHTTRFCSYWLMIGGGRGFSPIGPPSYIKYE